MTSKMEALADEYAEPVDEVQAEPAPDMSRAKLGFGKVRLASAVRNHHFVDLPAGVSVEMVMQRGYFRHYLKTFRPLDLIEIFAEDSAWEGLFRVMAVGDSEMSISPIHLTSHEDAEEPDSYDGHYVVWWGGPSLKWCVINDETKARIETGIQDKPTAERRRLQHIQGLRR